MAPKKENEGRKGQRKPPTNRIDVKRTPMSERQKLFSECDEDLCSVCWNEVGPGLRSFAVGLCDHPICSVCSVRSRVLCSTNDCAICRQDMPQIVFSSKVAKFKDLADRVLPKDKRYQICFEDDSLKKSFEELLNHSCPVCPNKPIFRTFKQLDTHVRREHERFYCELCTTDLKLFSHERKLYSRAELATHRRKGDPDDSSHKGHPLCQFCEARYVDDEALFRHLRRDHFFCHFCDADGIQEYYPDYNKLREHFKSDHYLCVEGGCANEQFTSAFRSELDLKAHRLDRHSGGLSKTENKQARMVGIDVSFSNNRQDRQRDRRQGPTLPGRSSSPEPPFSRNDSSDTAGQAKPVPDMSNDFPTLDGANVRANSSVSGNSGAGGSNNMATRFALSSGRNIQKSWATGLGASNLQDKDFPSLPGSQPLAAPTSVPQYKPSNLKKDATGTRNKKIPGLAPNTSDFPSLAPASNTVNAFGTPSYKTPNPYKKSWSTNQPAASNSNDVPNTSKKKNKQGKNKGGGSSEPVANNTKPNLKSAADLIFATDKGLVHENQVPLHLAKVNALMKNVQASNIVEDVTPENYSKIQSLSVHPDQEVVPKSKLYQRMPDLSEDFPSLGGGAKKLVFAQKVKPTNSGNSSVKQQGGNKNAATRLTNAMPFDPPEVVNYKQKTPDSSDDFPSLGGAYGKVQSQNNGNGGTENTSKIQSVVHPTQEVVTKRTPAQKVPDLSDDFPSLGGSTKSIHKFGVKSSNNGTSGNKKQTGKKNMGARLANAMAPGPPGFAQNKQQSKASGNVNFKYTSCKYMDPPDFRDRNSKLLNVICSAFGGGKSFEFANFKKLSNQFKENQIDSDQYIKDCSELLDDSTKIDDFMPELIALLPNIPKQTALIETFVKHYPQSNVSSQLDSCSICGQILARMDKRIHSQTHALDSDFPSL